MELSQEMDYREVAYCEGCSIMQSTYSGDIRFKIYNEMFAENCKSSEVEKILVKVEYITQKGTKMKILIYGAGNYCDLYLSSLKNQDDIVLGIVDGNSEKWGLKKCSYVINPPDIINNIPYEKLIIAVADYESVIDEIVKRKVKRENVFIYDGEKNVLLSLSNMYEEYLEKKIYRETAVKQVKMGLLMESYKENEYCEFERIIIVGEKEDYSVINDFFGEMDQNKKVIGYVEKMQIKEDDKIIFCGKNFKSDLAYIRTQLLSEQQWIVIPLFDVKQSINLW